MTIEFGPQMRTGDRDEISASTGVLCSRRLTGDEKVSTRPSSAYIWYVVVLLAVVNVFNYMDRMALSVLLPSIKEDLSLTDGQLGLLVGFAFSVFYAICGIPIARWADRGIRRNIIALALAIWSVMTALAGAAQNFWHLFLSRVGVGAGEAGCLPPSQSMICDYVPFERRPGVFAINGFGLAVGMMLGMALAGWLGGMIGWRWTFVMLGIPGIALAAIVRLTLREPERGFFDAAPRDDAVVSSRSMLVTLWHCRTYRLLVFYMILNGFVQFGFNQWWPSFYARTFGLDIAVVGIRLGILIGVGSGIGLLLGGVLANKAAHRDVKLPLIICAGTTFLALPAALGSLFVSSALDSMLLVALTTVLSSVPSGPVTASLYSVTSPGMRATAGALSIFVVSMLGFGLGPFCVGMLSDALAPSFGVQSLRYALLAPTVLLPIMVLAVYAAARQLPADLRASGAHVKTQRRG